MGARVDIQGSDPNAVAMRSAVNWAVLGLVIQRQGYGYDLYQRFDRTYGGALALSCEAQVYKALTALKNRGLIEELPASETSEDDRRQPKPRYRATPAAVPAYQDWLIFQVTQDRQRSALFSLQLTNMDEEDALVVIHQYQRHLLAEREMTADPTLPGGSSLADRLAQEARRLEASLAPKWAAYARRELEAAIETRGSGG